MRKQIRDRLNKITVVDVVVVQVAVVAVEIPSVVTVVPTAKPTVGGMSAFDDGSRLSTLLRRTPFCYHTISTRLSLFCPVILSHGY